MDKERKEIRFIISDRKWKQLKQEAKKLDVSLTNYIKMKLFNENA